MALDGESFQKYPIYSGGSSRFYSQKQKHNLETKNSNEQRKWDLNRIKEELQVKKSTMSTYVLTSRISNNTY